MSYYQELILEHYRHPQNAVLLENPSHTITLDNPLCGDQITLTLQVKNKVIEDVGYTTTGCAISIATSSLLSDKIKGKKVEEVLSFTKKDITAMLGIELSPNRLKCALLPLEAVNKAVISHKT